MDLASPASLLGHILSGAHMRPLANAERAALRFIASGVALGSLLGFLCGLLGMRGERDAHHR